MFFFNSLLFSFSFWENFQQSLSILLLFCPDQQIKSKDHFLASVIHLKEKLCVINVMHYTILMNVFRKQGCRDRLNAAETDHSKKSAIHS